MDLRIRQEKCGTVTSLSEDFDFCHFHPVSRNEKFQNLFTNAFFDFIGFRLNYTYIVKYSLPFVAEKCPILSDN